MADHDCLPPAVADESRRVKAGLLEADTERAPQGRE